MIIEITNEDRKAASPFYAIGHAWQPGMLDEAFARHRLLGQRQGLEMAANYLDGYAGGHYMAQSCADALRSAAGGV